MDLRGRAKDGPDPDRTEPSRHRGRTLAAGSSPARSRV